MENVGDSDEIVRILELDFCRIGMLLLCELAAQPLTFKQ